MPKEAALWSLVKQHLPKDAHFQRIETGGTGRGVPDVNYCQQGKEVWIELKSVSGLKSEVSSFQIAWLYNRVKSGGNCFVLIRKVNSKEKEIKLFDVNGMTLKELGEFNWKSESAFTLRPPYEWDALFKFILNSAL